MLYFVTLSSGETAIILNSIVVATYDPQNEPSFGIGDIAEKLSTALTLETHNIEMQTPADIDWNWDDVIELLPVEPLNRLNLMQMVSVDGYYKDSPSDILHGRTCLIGECPDEDDMSPDEQATDLNVLYYFESIEEVQVGFEIGDFVITAFALHQKT